MERHLSLNVTVNGGKERWATTLLTCGVSRQISTPWGRHTSETGILIPTHSRIESVYIVAPCFSQHSAKLLKCVCLHK